MKKTIDYRPLNNRHLRSAARLARSQHEILRKNKTPLLSTRSFSTEARRRRNLEIMKFDSLFKTHLFSSCLLPALVETGSKTCLPSHTYLVHSSSELSSVDRVAGRRDLTLVVHAGAKGIPSHVAAAPASVVSPHRAGVHQLNK